MTEPQEPTTPAEPAEAATAQPVEGAEPQPKLTDTVDYWKQMARQNEARAKANADAAKELQTIKDRDLSEAQRWEKQAAETATQLAELQRQNVLLSKGISADLTPPPPAAGPDDWAAYADRLLAWRGTIPSATPTAPAQPRPDKSQGATPIDGAAAEEAAYQAIAGLNWPHMTNNRK